MPDADAPGTLYRMYAANGDLLYIGITADIGARLKAHGRQQPWWTEVSTITLHHHLNGREALETAEMSAIGAEQPRYNVRRWRASEHASQHSVLVDDELWGRVAGIAGERREKVSEVLRRALVDYVAAHRDLLPD